MSLAVVAVEAEEHVQAAPRLEEPEEQVDAARCGW